MFCLNEVVNQIAKIVAFLDHEPRSRYLPLYIAILASKVDQITLALDILSGGRDPIVVE